MSSDSGNDAPQADVWAILYEDASRSPEVFVGAGAEEAARRRYDQASINCNCHLLAALRAAPPCSDARAVAEKAAKFCDEIASASTMESVRLALDGDASGSNFEEAKAIGARECEHAILTMLDTLPAVVNDTQRSTCIEWCGKRHCAPPNFCFYAPQSETAQPPASEPFHFGKAVRDRALGQQPNNDEVICPNCCHQFRAIPVNVQAELAALRADGGSSDAAAAHDLLKEWLDWWDGSKTMYDEPPARQTRAMLAAAPSPSVNEQGNGGKSA